MYPPRYLLMLLALATGLGCRVSEAERPVGARQRAAIADTLQRMMVAATDLSRPNVYERMVSLYAETGRVVSAGGGGLTASRDTVAAQLRAFWQNVGQNMQHPRWEWGTFYVDVLSPDAAVVTATYRVPHHTPAGREHIIGGVWTAVFERRGGKWGIIQEHLSDAPQVRGDSTHAEHH